MSSHPVTASARRPRVARAAAVLLALAAAAGAGLAQAQTLPELTTPVSFDVTEGDTGGTSRELVFTLNQPGNAEVAFDVALEYYDWSAVPTADFAPFVARRLHIPKGQTRASVFVEIYGDTRDEQDQEFRIVVSGLTGATYASGSGYGTTIRILDDDDFAQSDVWVVADDEFSAIAGFPDDHNLVLNDYVLADWFEMASFEVIEAPAHGSVHARPYGNFRYEGEPGFVGTDSFRYRFCDGDAGPCIEGRALMRVIPLHKTYVGGAGHSGYEEISGRAVEGLGLQASSLAPRAPLAIPLGVDRSPHDRGDAGGFGTHVGTFPASPAGATRERVLVVNGGEGGWMIHEAGVDTDGDGQVEGDEIQCLGGFECVLAATVGQAPVKWLVRAYNLHEWPATALFTVADARVDGDGSLTVTGPGRTTEWGIEDVHVGWNDPTLLDGEARSGVVRVVAADATRLVDVPFHVSRFGSESQPMPLVSGRPQVLALSGWTRQRHLFVDVPEGATRLSVVVGGGHANGTSFHVARRSAPLDPASSSVDAAPEVADAAATGNTNTGGGTVVVEGAALAPGRWYIVPGNDTDDSIALTVTATVEAVAPVVRPGSYFNPGRSGSGVFLYPAADQWTGLWYTYFADGRPTWYYLQAAAPGSDGLWRSPILRATWNGTTRSLTEVGEAVLTPTGADAFTLTYRIDGVVGTQPMQGLGRGCPAGDGAPVDISSTWFDPAKTGTGYSVQMWDDYEYHAAFVYDEQGVPMFLAAELDRFGGDEATLVLQRLVGACPTCAFVPSTRTDVGTFVRRLAAGALDGVEIDAVWQDGNPPYWLPPESAWSAEDHVQLLGGAGTTQGCAP